jgi:beta-N-acetylhexosaminidase
MDRRRVLQSGLAATLMAIAGPAAQARMRASLREQLDRPLADRVGDMLLLGFIGSHNETEGADIIDAHLAANRIGGVLFLRHNVRSREGAEGSAARFLATRPGAWMAIDQEGGLVQRLSRDLGYTHLPRAMQVAEARSPQGAGDLYRLGAGEFRAAGFNKNLAPVADLHDPDNAVIGRHGRAYGTDGIRSPPMPRPSSMPLRPRASPAPSSTSPGMAVRAGIVMTVSSISRTVGARPSWRRSANSSTRVVRI